MKELSGSSASAVCAAVRYTIADDHLEASYALDDVPEDELHAAEAALVVLADKIHRRRTAAAVKAGMPWPNR